MRSVLWHINTAAVPIDPLGAGNHGHDTTQITQAAAGGHADALGHINAGASRFRFPRDPLAEPRYVLRWELSQALIGSGRERLTSGCSQSSPSSAVASLTCLLTLVAGGSCGHSLLPPSDLTSAGAVGSGFAAVGFAGAAVAASDLTAGSAGRAGASTLTAGAVGGAGDGAGVQVGGGMDACVDAAGSDLTSGSGLAAGSEGVAEGVDEGAEAGTVAAPGAAASLELPGFCKESPLDWVISERDAVLRKVAPVCVWPGFSAYISRIWFEMSVITSSEAWKDAYHLSPLAVLGSWKSFL